MDLRNLEIIANFVSNGDGHLYIRLPYMFYSVLLIFFIL